MAQERVELEIPERVKERIRGCQWQIQDLRAWRRRLGGDTGDGTGLRMDAQGLAAAGGGASATQPGGTADEGTGRWVSRKTLVRRCEWPERADAALAVEFLSREECLPYLRLCREELGETDWRPRFAWFEQEDANNTRARGGYLYHAMRLRGADNGEDGPYLLEDGCKRKVTATFYWGVNELPECPKSESGINYELQVRGYNDETGEYDCVITRTETVEQDVLPYDSHQELGETRRTAQMLGVREEEASSVDGKIKAFAEAQGVALEDGKVGEGDDAEGRVVDVQKQKNADCTTDVTILNTHEERVEKRTVEGTQTIRGKRLRITDEHVAPEAGEDADGYPLVGPKAGVLTSKTVTKTPGGVRNVTTEETESVPVNAGEGNGNCEQTIYEHRHTKVGENLKDKPEDDAPSAGGGKHYAQTVQRNDDDTWNVQSTETEELKVEGARKSSELDRFEKTDAVTDANVTEAPEARSVTPPDGFVEGTIVRTEEQKNPGGSVTKTTTTRTASGGQIEVTFKTDGRGSTRRYAWFHNLTKAEMVALAANYTSGNVSINAFGLYDGTLGDVLGGDGRQLSSGRKFGEFHETQTSVDGRLIIVGNKVLKLTITITYVRGVVHDSDPSEGSKTSAFAMVDGCADQRVEQLGNGYWSYYGVSGRTEEYAYVGKVPDGTSSSVSASW